MLLIIFISRYEWLLSLRAITKNPVQFFNELKKEFTDIAPNPVFGTESDPNLSPNFVYNDMDFRVLLNFVTLSDKFSTVDHHYTAFAANFFVLCLKHAGYFQTMTSEDAELEKFIGKL